MNHNQMINIIKLIVIDVSKFGRTFVKVKNGISQKISLADDFFTDLTPKKAIQPLIRNELPIESLGCERKQAWRNGFISSLRN